MLGERWAWATQISLAPDTVRHPSDAGTWTLAHFSVGGDGTDGWIVAGSGSVLQKFLLRFCCEQSRNLPKRDHVPDSQQGCEFCPLVSQAMCGRPKSVTVPQNQRIVELHCALFNGCGPLQGSGAVHALTFLSSLTSSAGIGMSRQKFIFN